MRLFWERGYDGTSISDLTDAIGIAPPSLYAAFGDKRTLFEEAADLYQQQPDSFATRALEEPNTRRAIARLLHDAAIEYTRSGQPRGCMILSEPLLGTHRQRSRATLIERLRQGQAARDLPADTDLGSLANYITAVLAGLSSQARDGATRNDLIDVAEEAMRAWPTSD